MAIAAQVGRSRRTIERETALGFESRARMNCGAALLRAAIPALRRRYRFAPGAFAERASVLSQALFFERRAQLRDRQQMRA